MANYYKMPPLGSPVADSAGVITQAWATLLREFQTGLNAELAPGRVQPFWLSAADLADPTKFMQAGANVGKGVREYLGWAKCDGNDSRPNPGDTFLRFSLTDSAGTTGGSNSSAHGHANGSLSSSTFQDVAGNAVCAAPNTSGAGFFPAALIGTLGAPGVAGGNYYGIPVCGAIGAASATDNRPAFYSWVPLIRIPVTVTP